MNAKKYIDKTTYQVNSSPIAASFAVDELIAQDIAQLNQHGYYTLASSVGELYHDEYFEMIIAKEEKEEIAKLKRIGYCLPADQFNYLFRLPITSTRFYITFKDASLLPSIPRKFTLINNTIEARISYVKNEKTFLEDGDKTAFLPNYKVEEQIIAYAEIIHEWVKHICH